MALLKSSFARVIAKYAFLVYVAMFYMNYPRCGDCAYSHISFIRECTDARDVSYVTGTGRKNGFTNVCERCKIICGKFGAPNLHYICAVGQSVGKYIYLLDRY